MLAVFKYIVVLLIAAAGLMIYVYSPVFHSTFIPDKDFSEMEKNVYFDRHISSKEAGRLKNFLHQARLRIEGDFGKMVSEPVIIFIGNNENIKKFGLDNYAIRAYITPWKSYLLISESVSNNYAMTHEYFHIEIAERLGYRVKKLLFPVWLDEGLAMQVDDRKRYQLDKYPVSVSEINRVRTLWYSSEFWSEDKKQNIRNVLAAKAAVATILKNHADKSLYHLLDRVKLGEDVDMVFSTEESHGIQAY